MLPLKTVVRTVKSMHFLTYTFYPQNIFFVNSIIVYSIFFLQNYTKQRAAGRMAQATLWYDYPGLRLWATKCVISSIVDVDSLILLHIVPFQLSLLCGGFTVRHRSPLVSAGAKSDANHHSADPLHPKKSLWASASPVRRREPCNLLRLLSHPSTYGQYSSL